MSPATELMQRIVERHATLGLDSNTDPAALPADDSAFAIAYAAARRLGFIAADAGVIAQAWQRQSDRSGAFLAGAMTAQDAAQPSTPVLGTPFWHQG